MMEVAAVVVVLQISEHWYETKNMKTKKNIFYLVFIAYFFFWDLNSKFAF